MEFQRVLKKESIINQSIKKEVDFIGVIKKKSCGISIGLRFLALKLSRGVAQICGIFRGESLFSKSKVTDILVSRVFFWSSFELLFFLVGTKQTIFR